MSKMFGYVVTKREKCPECEQGRIQHPLWEQFFELFTPPEQPGIDDERDYWSSFGYYGNDPLPDEEIDCPECEGQGYNETEAALLGALWDIGILDDILDRIAGNIS